jgi:hypothetical protein
VGTADQPKILMKMKTHKILVLMFMTFLTTTLVLCSCTREENEVKKMVGKSTSVRTSTDSTYASNNYKLWKLQNSNVSVLFPMNDVGTSHIWIIQDSLSNGIENIVTITNAILSTYDKKFVKLTYGTNNEIHYLLTGASYQNYESNSVGITRLENGTLLNDLRTMNDSNKNDLIDDVQAKAHCKDIPSNPNPKGDESCKCAGGYGATECSCGGSIASLSWSEQVSCGVGKYACCTGL